ncbi:hypothetical protein [Mycobacterium tilburgii]|uniref:hypothetical protein n=1 Tax=Mycobacterium tilburgii TaxID=44467 RepID=UPI0021B229D9|nr:hypothetical protein [Mycobacterium tilburgii]
MALTAGIVFGVGQFATSNFLSVPSADVVASLLSSGAVVLLLQVRRPQTTPARRGRRGR